MKQFIFPEFVRGDQVCAVYKMVFDCGSYYIGSALDLRQRLHGWKATLNSGVAKNYRVTEAFKNTTTVNFEIMDIVEDPIMRKFREDGYIKIHYGKPGCLNIATNALNNIGIKQNPNKKSSTHNSKTVAKIDDYGNIVEQYKSVREANEKNNTFSVSDCFKNSLRKVKGMMFRELDKDGNIIPAPLPPLRDRKQRKRGYKISEVAKQSRKEKRLLRIQSADYVPPKLPQQTKPVYQYSIEGELVKKYQSVQAAAREVGTNPSNFRKILKGRGGRNYHKGFIYKYI